MNTYDNFLIIYTLIYMKNKAWVIHRVKTSNLGDKLLGQGLKSILEEFNYNVKIAEYTGRDDIYILYYAKKYLNKSLLQYIVCFCAVLSCFPALMRDKPSIVFIGGGQLLLPNKKFMSSLLAWSFITKILNIRSVLFSVGTEYYEDKYGVFNKILLKTSLRMIDQVFLRDDISQREINSLINESYGIVPDVAYGLNLKHYKRNKINNVCVCLSNYSSTFKYSMFKCRSEYFDEVISKIKSVIKDDYDIVLLSTVNKDYEALEEAKKYLLTCFPKNKVIVKYIHSEHDLLIELGCTKYTISSRMHALIISHILGAEIVSINRNYKIISYYENYSYKDPDEIRRDLKTKVGKIIKYKKTE